MGMESIKLSRPWLDHAAKETVQVDPLRAAWLRENGYAAAGSVLKMGEVDLTPHVVRAELVLRPTEPELQSPFLGVEITAPTPAPSPRRELVIQPQALPLALTETQIEDMGDGPAMVEQQIRQTLDKRESEPEGHIVSRSKRKSLMKELSEPLTLDVDVKEP